MDGNEMLMILAKNETVKGATMGGSGSGRWYRWETAKTTVEQSLAVSISQFRGKLVDGAAGTLTWTLSDGRQASASFGVEVPWDERIVTLSYRLASGQDVSVRLLTEISYPNFGGCRWWFTCPLVVNGRACQRRVGKV